MRDCKYKYKAKSSSAVTVPTVLPLAGRQTDRSCHFGLHVVRIEFPISTKLHIKNQLLIDRRLNLKMRFYHRQCNIK